VIVGYLSTLGWVGSIDMVGLEMAIYGHLTSNMYPPCGGALPLAYSSVQCVAGGYEPDDDEYLSFVLPNGAHKTAHQVVDELHLEPFVEYVQAGNEWDDDIGGDQA
jgi:hypothetical protein